MYIITLYVLPAQCCLKIAVNSLSWSKTDHCDYFMWLFIPTLNKCFYGYLIKICSELSQVATRERKPRGIIRFVQ